MGMVDRAKEYIAAGDIFQVVLAQRFSVPFTLPPFALYRALRRTNPSPFLFYLDYGVFALVGSSPEILVRVRGGEVTIRPLAGTRRRGASTEEDKALESELLADPKERAEHLMLLDLGRNDVGRVAEIGSVRVTESFAVERYSHVMHIVSHVVGRLDAKHDAIDALMAGRRAGEGEARPVRRVRRLFLRRRRDGQLHRAAHRTGQGRRDVRAGGSRRRRRQRPRRGAGRVRPQGPRPLQGRRGGGTVRRAGEAG
jgi:anthranilate synthase component 1